MAKIGDRPTRRVHLILFEDEYQKLISIAQDADTSVSRLLRSIIYTFLLHTEDKIRKEIDKLERETEIKPEPKLSQNS